MIISALSAGRSARRWGRETSWQASPFRRLGLPTLIFAAIVGYFAFYGGNRVLLGVCTFLFFVELARAGLRQYRNPEVQELKRQAANRKEGGVSEKKHALSVSIKLIWHRVMLRGPFWGMHDIAIPGSNAQLDHLWIGRFGVVHDDSKKRAGKFEVHKEVLWRVFYDTNAKRRQERVNVESTLFETSSLEKIFKGKNGRGKFSYVPVRTIWSVRQPENIKNKGPARFGIYENGRLRYDRWNSEGVEIFDHKRTAAYVASLPKALTRKEARTLYLHLRSKLYQK